MSKKKGVSNAVIVLIGLLLLIFPDPTDALDFGLPVFEAIGTIAALFLNNRGKK